MLFHELLPSTRSNDHAAELTAPKTDAKLTYPSVPTPATQWMSFLTSPIHIDDRRQRPHHFASALAGDFQERDCLTNVSIRERTFRLPAERQTIRLERAKEIVAPHTTWIGHHRDARLVQRSR